MKSNELSQVLTLEYPKPYIGLKIFFFKATHFKWYIINPYQLDTQNHIVQHIKILYQSNLQKSETANNNNFLLP
jgi:hypothetical protein